MLVNAVSVVFVKPLLDLLHVVVSLFGLLVASPVLLVALVSGRRVFSDFFGLFNLLNKLPLGKEVFALLSLLTAPYSMSTGVRVELFEKRGQELFIQAIFTERPWLHNPFSSIHAIALANVGEYTGGLAMLAYLQQRDKRLRGIVNSVRASYTKKARGKITAITSIGQVKEVEEILKSQSSESVNVEVECKMVDEQGDTVATFFANWAVSLKPEKKSD